MLHLPHEVVEHICHKLDAESIFDLLKTCKTFLLEDLFFKNRCYQLYGIMFWECASLRPKKYHFSSWKKEFKHIEYFQSAMAKIEGRRWRDEDFYKLWTVMP